MKICDSDRSRNLRCALIMILGFFIAFVLARAVSVSRNRPYASTFRSVRRGMPYGHLREFQNMFISRRSVAAFWLSLKRDKLYKDAKLTAAASALTEVAEDKLLRPCSNVFALLMNNQKHCYLTFRPCFNLKCC